MRTPAKIDWLGNVTFAVGLILVLVGITYGLLPYGGKSMGWTNPKVLAEIFGGLLVLVVFGIVETRVKQPMFRLSLFRIRAFSAGNARQLPGLAEPRRPDVHADHLAPGDLAPVARL